MDLAAFEVGAKKNCPIYEFLGLQVLEAENGVFKASIPNTKASGNHIGIMHAGALFSLGEFLGGLITARYLDDPRKFQPVVRVKSVLDIFPVSPAVVAKARLSSTLIVDMICHHCHSRPRRY